MEDEFVVGEKGKAECTQVHNNNRKAFRGEEQFFCALCAICTALPKRASGVSNIMSEHIEVQYKASGGCCTVALFHILNSIVTQFTN